MRCEWIVSRVESARAFSSSSFPAFSAAPQRFLLAIAFCFLFLGEYHNDAFIRGVFNIEIELYLEQKGCFSRAQCEDENCAVDCVY